MHKAGNEETELWLLVDDGMAARNRDAGIGADGGGAFQHAPQWIKTNAIHRPRNKAQCADRPRAHGVNVTQCVGGSDAAIVIRIINDRREYVDGLNECKVIGELNNSRVVSRAMTNKNSWIANIWQP